MRTRVAGVITGVHDIVRKKVAEIAKGTDAEAAGMAELWFNRVEDTDFADVNFNRDVYEKMRSKKSIPADMTYFTFRNHFLSKVINPIRDAIRDYLVQKDSELKHDQSELDWLNGFLNKYVALASYDRVSMALKNELNQRFARLANEKEYAEEFFGI